MARLRSQRPLHNRRLQQIAGNWRDGRVEGAEEVLAVFVARNPDDANALLLLGKFRERRGRLAEALEHVSHAVEIHPDFLLARFERAKLLGRLHRFDAALAETGQLLASEPLNPLFRRLKATLLADAGEEELALRIFRELAEENADRAECWISYGDMLRVRGLSEKSVAAYRKAIACRPTFGLAWWSLANLKTFRFDKKDLGTITRQLDDPLLAAEDRTNLLFALGKAYEDMGAYDRAFECYTKGNAARRLATGVDDESLTSRVAEKKEVFTCAFFVGRNKYGCAATDPIFIVGRPRSGSTLVEQILCSHPAIEGTAELPYLNDLVSRIIEEECPARSAPYPEIFASLEPAVFRKFGEEYIQRSRIHRKTERPFFIDKAPANYHHVGLIQLILPNARIIDVRRHPIANCVSMYRHNYTTVNLRLVELGRVYRDYVALMAHFDRVLPGRIHRVIYEQLVADPAAEVRRILAYIGLPFDEQCLRFHENDRSVRSPSSEQVRRPISGEAVDWWRHFERWTGPLANTLGSVLDAYPQVPDELL